MGNFLTSFFNAFFRNREELELDYDMVGVMSPEELVEHDALNAGYLDLRRRADEFNTRQSLFWARLKLRCGVYDRTLKIENGMLLALRQEKTDDITPSAPE